MPKVYHVRDPNRPEDAVYIGRPGKWGNPFGIGPRNTREDVIRLHAEWLPTSGLNLEELRGKDLVCFCSPLPCHGDTLLKEANR